MAGAGWIMNPSQKKDGLWNHPFLHNLNVISYFFLVFVVAFVAVFFVVPHEAPLDLHAITNLLHKRYFQNSTVLRCCQQMKWTSQTFPCRQLYDRDIIIHLHTSGGRKNDMYLMQKRDPCWQAFSQKIHLPRMRRRPAYLLKLQVFFWIFP